MKARGSNMNIAIILAGGTGSRMRSGKIPKQYMIVHGRPVFTYALTTFQKNKNIDTIVIVAEEGWHDIIKEWIHKDKISKFRNFANPGKTRQHSIYSGLQASEGFAEDNDIVIIHDVARPLVSEFIIEECLKGARQFGGAMPVLPMKDTVYLSEDGRAITGLLNRDELYAGQAPEAFVFGDYLKIHRNMTDDELGKTRGSSEIAYKNGIHIKLVEGSEINFKITTKEDLEKFESFIENGDH